MDMTEALPDDALASILHRLPACDLAASRCVRKAWRAVVDARRLLLPHLLPHSLQSIFINYIDYERPHCFSRPSARKPLIDGNLDYLPGYTQYFNTIIDHCNGLVLYEAGLLYVVNPATRRWDSVRCKDDVNQAYLVFDPAVSPHYELFFIPDIPKEDEEVLPGQQANPHDSMEWPPSLWTMNVFSSSSRQWQKRLCFSSGTYQVIKTPVAIGKSKNVQYLGKSEKGVYLATIYNDRQLRVCNLVESDGQIDWVLKHHVDLDPLTSLPWQDLSGFKQTWTLDEEEKDDDYEMMKKTLMMWMTTTTMVGEEEEEEEEKGEGENNNIQKGVNLRWNSEDDDEKVEVQDENEEEERGKNDALQMEEYMEWNSDDENVMNIEDDYNSCGMNIYFLGFHPYKEVIFLGLSLQIGVAYHLKSSKVQYLGKIRPKDYHNGHATGMFDAFPYTPCMIGELQKHASRSH
ncbi:hypothetical protein ACQ4PT_041973 [Festuca glaucescens]